MGQPYLCGLAGTANYNGIWQNIPSTMSMCILVPDFPAMPDYAECTALLRHMCVIREFPAGTQIFARATANGGHELMSGEWYVYTTTLLYCPPRRRFCVVRLTFCVGRASHMVGLIIKSVQIKGHSRR